MATNPGSEISSIDFGSLIGGPLLAVIEAQTQAARATADFVKTVGFDSDNRPVYVDFTYPKEIQPYQPKIPAHVIAINVTNGGSGYDSANPPSVTIGAAENETAATATAVVENGIITRINLTDGGVYSDTTATAPTVTIGAPSAATSTTATATATFAGTQAAVPAVFQDMRIQVPILTMLPVPFIRVEKATVDFNAKINAMETSQQSSDFSIAGDLEAKQRWPGGSAKLTVSCSYQRKTATGSSVERTYSMQVHVEATQDEMPSGMERLLGILESNIIATPTGTPA